MTMLKTKLIHPEIMAALSLCVSLLCLEESCAV